MEERSVTHKNEKQSLKRKFLIWFIPFLVVNLQKLIGFTSRRINIGNESIEKIRREKKPYILSIWHTNVLYSPYLNRNLGVAVLISESKDGDFINQVVHRFGNCSVRGSSSKGGSRALKALVTHLKKNLPAAITPDGPRGPALVVQPGLIASAQISQVPIVPFHYECTRQWVAERSWDKHRIPKPFTTFVVSYGESIYIPRDLDEKGFEEARLKVEKAMLENRQRSVDKAEELRKR
ncbi:lysophospholipid acyltransferase family protein [Leptospira borgpetersenii]|uniref:lysophospholipid acyltransferase family protein n=1 Tax=Leptospira borgpetersenii TaxID=174 RepID=UPI000772DD65|nr:lysophospholipid acyltransferase family protein [Leptospira borgpetersenii]MBE8365367.1 lysophospholipid acyltransferase family protein [Leptospira borgpetersenii serovar Balcanica]MBE8367608.1 lysophospholipid acyltransferase family protein [Leptospira borgpetersenii serovar Balcanica]MBE8424489.1 lysophospholipid acyltransferase family protein [Leptospira borgpetersenii serovar Balcanica]MBF3351582.1 lysophospholipid acyltransferase family protein [Leptospira borgpetersenii serovar Balcani